MGNDGRKGVQCVTHCVSAVVSVCFMGRVFRCLYVYGRIIASMVHAGARACVCVCVFV